MTLEHTGLNGGKVSDWLRPAIPGLMVGKLLIGQDFATCQEGSVRLSHSNTRLEYGDSVDGTAFP